MAQENSQPDFPEVPSRMSFFEEFAATAQNITHSERRTPIFQNLETKASTSKTALTEPSIQSSFPSPLDSSQDGHKEPHPENWMCLGAGPSPPGAKNSAQNPQERFIRWNALSPYLLFSSLSLAGNLKRFVFDANHQIFLLHLQHLYLHRIFAVFLNNLRQGGSSLSVIASYS